MKYHNKIDNRLLIIMKEFSPHIVVSGLSSRNSDRMRNILCMVESKLKEMGIRVFFMPEHFSPEESASWVADVTTQDDFLLNFEFSDEKKIYYKGDEEHELAKIFQNEISRRSDDDYESLHTFAEMEAEDADWLRSFALHSYNIYFSPHKTDSEIKMNIMACVTDICFIPHLLVSEDKRWAFRDVPSYHFAAESIKKAKEKGVIPGYKGDIVYPNGGVTRGEMIYMLDKIGKL